MNLCVYCLAGIRRNNRTLLEVQEHRNSPPIDIYRGNSAPQQVTDWVIDQIGKIPAAGFLIDGIPGALLAAATWRGDSVCEIHLVELVK